jgi:hypothetical protein
VSSEMSVHELTWELVAKLQEGRAHPRSVAQLAADLGVSRRMVQALKAEAIDAGYLIGSTCNGEHGFFLIADEKDLEVGTAHTIARARSSLAGVAKLRRLAAVKFGAQHPALTLFDLEEVS